MPATQQHCPLNYCDPHECGWRSGDTSCEWNDQAITTTVETITEGEPA